jgi:hypothetical protein
VNGNPRYDISFDDGTIATSQSDASFCYAINNPEFRNRQVEVTFTRAGRVAHIEPVQS